MERIVRFSKLLEALSHKTVLVPGDPEIGGVSFDSRCLSPGDLFVAVKGFRTDGHLHIPEALKRGASAVVGEDGLLILQSDRLPEWKSIPMVSVPDSRKALAHLAAAFYDFPARHLRVVGITGTDGKTTTAHMISAILEEAGYRTGLVGTVYFKIGERIWENPCHQTTPESPHLQRLLAEMVREGVDYAIIEASSHGLALDRVVGCEFDAAVFTNLTSDHMDFHGDRQQYLQEKGKLFLALGESANKGYPKTAILNADDPSVDYLRSLSSGQTITYGVKRPSTVQASHIQVEAGRTTFTASTPRGEVSVRLPLLGRFNVYNALASIALALSQGVGLPAIKAALERVKGVSGRMELVEAGQDFVVVVDFAHTPNALEHALETIRHHTKERVIVLFGCPGERDRSKRPEMGKIASRLADFLVLTNDEPRSEEPLSILEEIEHGARSEGKVEGLHYLKIPDRRRAMEIAFQKARTGDTVLLAGKGHEDCIIIGKEKIPWSDKGVALELLRKRRTLE